MNLQHLKDQIIIEFDFKPILAWGGGILGGAFLSKQDLAMWQAFLIIVSTFLVCVYTLVKICFVIAKWRRLNEKDVEE